MDGDGARSGRRPSRPSPPTTPGADGDVARPRRRLPLAPRLGRPRRAARRAIGALAVLVLVLVSLATTSLPPGTDPAGAALGTSQALTNRVAYGPNEAVYASGNVTFMTGCKPPAHPHDGVDDIFQPWADLYIVPTGTVALGGGLRDISGAPNVVFGGFAGGFVEELIGFTGPGGTIPAGIYDIVIDDCQDGVFDPTDSLMSEAFRVTIPLGTEPAVVGGPLKARAATLAGDHAKLALAWQLMLEAISNTKVAGAVSINALSDMSIAIFQAQAQTVLPDPRAAMSGALVQLGRANAGLAADPPDPAFPAHAPVVLPAAVGPGHSGELLETLLVDSARSAGVDAALIAALVTAVERHQGAAQVGNGDWMAAHARDAVALIDLIQARATVTSDILLAVRAEFRRLSPPTNALRSWYTQLVERPVEYSRFGGDTNFDQRDGQNRGLTRSAVDEWMHGLMDLVPAAPLAQSTQMDAAIDGVVATTAAQVAEMAPLRTELLGALDGLAAEGRDAPRPTAAAGGPYTAATGTPMTLDASASVPSSGSSPLVAHEWDLDLDGAFDDATGPVVEHTPTRAGSTVVGVRVTDEAGATDVAYAAIDVALGDLPPAITAVTSTPAVTPAGSSVVLVERDAPFTLGITAEDPEGQPVAITWHRDGEPVPVGTGTTLAAPALGSYGSVRYEAVATDPAGNLAARTFVVTAFGPDADGDGWRVPADCDDTRNTVHPARVEVYGNGLDDDCDPETSDDPGTILPPTISTVALDTNRTWGNGWQVGDLVHLNVNWGHAIRHTHPFAWTVDWGDGTVTSGEVVASSPGTYFQDTQIPASHVYRTGGFKQVTACITGPLLDDVPDHVPHETCRTSGINGTNAMFPVPPAVHPANLQDWDIVDITPALGPPEAPGEWQVTPDGSSAITRRNQTYPSMVVSDFELDTTDGPGRIAVDLGTANTGDDDIMGFALGIPPDAGELSTADADWVTVQLKGWSGGESSSGHCLQSIGSRPTPPIHEPDPNQIMRHRGVGHHQEYFYGVTFDLEPAADVLATCLDAAGTERLDSARMPAPLARINQPGAYKYLRPPEQLALRDSFRAELYRMEIEYSPSEIIVWVDGIELMRATAPPDDPFPQGRVGLLTQSQPGVRFVGHTQAPREAATQGEARDFTATFADPGEEGQYTAVVEWGDGTPASVGEIEAIDGRPGFFTVTAEHAYARAGSAWAEVCVTDQTDGLVGCGSIDVTVANAAPIVDAGPDTLTGGEVTLEGVTYRDPGIHDSHTATIDWGEGAGPEPVTPIAEATGAGIVEGTHAYTEAGVHTVEVCVTDQLGARGCDTRDVEVRTERTEALAAHITDGPTIPEGTPVDIGAAFTDSLPGAIHRVVIDWGDGTVEDLVDLRAGRGTVPAVEDGDPAFAVFGSGWATHTYADDGAYTVTASICDDTVDCDDPGDDPGPGLASVQTTVTVTDVPPSVDATWIVGDGQVDLSALVTDPGARDTHTATIDWGDGTVQAGVPVLGGPEDGTVTAAHRYSALGSYTVEICVADDDNGASGCDGTEVTITELSLAPVVVALDPVGPTTEGSPVTFTGTYLLPDGHDGSGLAILLRPEEGATALVAALDPVDGTFTASHTYTDDGSHTVAVEACATGAACGTASAGITVTNVAPAVDAGTDRTTDGPLALDGVTFTDPGTADTHTATVDWGDGTPVQPATVVPAPGGGLVSAQHTYADAGTYTVTVCVTDDDGGSSCDTFTATVHAESAFTVSIVPVTPIDEGGTATVAFTVSTVGGPEGVVPEALVRWGDGTTPTPVALTVAGDDLQGSAGHTYVQDATFTATVEACHEDICGTATTLVTVANVAPTVTAATLSPAGPGAVNLDATFTDPGAADTHTATVDWGDGTTTAGVVASRTVTAGHTYAADGTYTVVVCVADDSDDPAGCMERTVAVDDVPNVAPTVVLDGLDGTRAEGSPVTLSGTVADADGVGPLALVVDWGDGTSTAAEVEAGPFSLTHTYADDGTYAIVATVDDGTDTHTARLYGIEVANVAPEVAIETSVEALAVTVEVSATDPGVDDELSGTVDWGDGTIEDLPLKGTDATERSAGATGGGRAAVGATATHTFAAAGTYAVEVCVRDDDGGRTCRAEAAAVRAGAGPERPEPPAPSPPAPVPTPPVPPPSGGGAGPGAGGGATGATSRGSGTLPRTGGHAPVAPALVLVIGGAALVVGVGLAARRRRGEATGAPRP